MRAPFLSFWGFRKKMESPFSRSTIVLFMPFFMVIYNFMHLLSFSIPMSVISSVAWVKDTLIFGILSHPLAMLVPNKLIFVICRDHYFSLFQKTFSKNI